MKRVSLSQLVPGGSNPSRSATGALGAAVRVATNCLAAVGTSRTWLAGVHASARRSPTPSTSWANINAARIAELRLCSSRLLAVRLITLSTPYSICAVPCPSPAISHTQHLLLGGGKQCRYRFSGNPAWEGCTVGLREKTRYSWTATS